MTSIKYAWCNHFLLEQSLIQIQIYFFDIHSAFDTCNPGYLVDKRTDSPRLVGGP